MKILLAITSSGTVASWTIWGELPFLWKFFSALSALVAIVLPFLNYQGTIESLSTLSGKWWEAKRDYENYWMRLENAQPVEELQKEFYSTKARESELIKMETKLPHDARLLRRCQKEVLQSRGLTKTKGVQS